MSDQSIDYSQELQQALYDRLRTGITDATVHQHVPDKTPMPVVMIGDMAAEDQGVKGAVFDRWSITINTITKGPQRKPCSALMAQVRGLLDGWKPDAAGGVVFGTLYHLDSTASLVVAEEEVYLGSQSFTTTTEPA